MNKLLEQAIDYWPISVLIIELFIVILFVLLIKGDGYWKRHRLFYALECERALNNQNVDLIDKLRQQIHQGNIKYLEDKKQWLERERDLRFKYQASILITENEIKKVEKQIEKLKSK